MSVSLCVCNYCIFLKRLIHIFIHWVLSDIINFLSHQTGSRELYYEEVSEEDFQAFKQWMNTKSSKGSEGGYSKGKGHDYDDNVGKGKWKVRAQY